ncbi:flowering time control protein FPA isoform X2 [Syzygium oleosum]|uniref:flowering time control protein FPA isoform X2 n=1 Tax=Syzygium oleosum TaxID=219896 RepID=UPI0024BB3BD4|nr:flowering time control protein FPA isoform X2 [Syzygium oleosum]
MSGRIGGGRERPRRLEDRSSSGQSGAPPSRHLWVGNLSHSISEGDLVRPFLRFGELESVAFQPGRSYAFVNFKIEDGAIAALKALQGFPLAGSPLRIEFAKDKSSVPSHNEEYFEHNSEQRPSSRESPLLQKDSRVRHSSPEPFHLDRPKMNDKAAEPSEVLWIGFPASLKVDETILGKAFSPFGEIERITTFPGRTYAFVRFINLISACRAKETLQGKLFGNPRVHICFAKNESGSSSGGRSSISGPLSPRYQSNGRHGSSESFWHDMDNAGLTGNPSVRSPRTFTDLDSEGHDGYEFSRKGNLRRNGFSSLEHRRFGEEESESRPSHSVYEFRGSPKRDWDPHLPYPNQGFSQTGAFYEDQWDILEEVDVLHGPKRLKSNAYPPDNELPEFQLSDLRRENQAFSHVLSDSVRSDPFGIEYEQMVRRSDHPRASYENIQTGSGSLPTVNVERKRITPEIKQSSVKEWKWEGTIAKGGSPVCRARCFPVGKVLDILLPKFLDCTARTGLEMLAKHYYQASATWVVFFVPGTDADIGFYNEFMHYLEEKQRAAVAKLDERNTLFLVPPSEFSQKVLKVPGKLSISGVVLRLEQPGSKFGAAYHPDELEDPKLVPFPGHSLYPKPSTPSRTQFLETSKLGPGNRYFAVDAATSVPSVPFSIPLNAGTSKYDTCSEDRDEYLPQQQNLLQSNSHYLATSSGTRSAQSQLPSSTVDSIPRMVQLSANSGVPLSGNDNMPVRDREALIQSSTPLLSLQPEQLSQLASLLGQQRQSIPNISGGKSDGYSSQDVKATSSELPVSHYGEVQPFHQQQHPQHLLNLSAASKELKAGAQGSQQVSSSGSQEAEADPQKRLQATLQLAAALLQQIQQGNKGS